MKIQINKAFYHILSIVTILLCCYTAVYAQKKEKQFEVWISSAESQKKIKGLLHEINDSSVLVNIPELTGNEKSSIPGIKEIPFNKIDVIKIRKRGNILRGGLYGSVIGLSGGILAFLPFYSDFNLLASFAALYFCTATTVTGGVIGIASGTLKDRIPVKGRFENFERYRSCLQEYSYLKETKQANHFFEHRSNAGFTTGLTFPLGKFIAGYSGFENQKMEKVGTGGNFEIGHRFTKNFGVLILQNYTTFDVIDENSTNSDNFYWSLGGIEIGPVFTANLNKKLNLGISPKIGFLDVSFYEEMEEKFNGTAPCFDLSGYMHYNYSKRWSLAVETEYLHSSLKYNNNRQGTINTIALNVGLLYRFSKYSL